MPNPILVDESVFDESFVPERLVARKTSVLFVLFVTSRRNGRR